MKKKQTMKWIHKNRIVSFVRFGALTLMVLVNPLLSGNEKKNYVYHDQIFHYSITLPAEWKRIPVKDFQFCMEEYKRMLPQRAAEEIAFVKTGFYVDGNNYFDYPYILISNYEMAYRPFEEIEKEYLETDISKEIADINQEMKEFIKNFSFDKPLIDPMRKMVLIKLHDQGEKMGGLVTLMAICYGKERRVQMNFSSLETEYSKYLPTFYSIIRSFKFDLGYAYEDFGGIKNKYLRKIIESGWVPIVVSGIVVLLIAHFSKKRRERLKRMKER